MGGVHALSEAPRSSSKSPEWTSRAIAADWALCSYRWQEYDYDPDVLHALADANNHHFRGELVEVEEMIP